MSVFEWVLAGIVLGSVAVFVAGMRAGYQERRAHPPCIDCGTPKTEPGAQCADPDCWRSGPRPDGWKGEWPDAE